MTHSTRRRKVSLATGFPGRPTIVLLLAILVVLGSLPITTQPLSASPGAPTTETLELGQVPSGEVPQTSMTGPGTYKLVATREGLVGQMTSSGHYIQPNDHFVALPACTATNCSWHSPGERHERWGLRTECGDKCYVKVINEDTRSCEVAPILDTGPWFTNDDWWRPANQRHLNTLESNEHNLAQGVTGASAARNGLDVGYGISSTGYGASNRYSSVGNAAAIDVADGTWMALGLDFNKGIDVIDVELLWQTGGNPASEAAACGHQLGQSGTTPPTTVPNGSNPSFSGSKLPISSSSSTRSTNASTRAHDGSLSTDWHTTGGTPSETSLTLDLGQARQVSGAKWTFSQEDGADSLTLAVSPDGLRWTTIGTSSNRRAGTWEGMAIGRSARYVRLIFTNPNGDASIGHVAEVEVWGDNTRTTPPSPAPDPTPYPGSNPSYSGSNLRIASASSSASPQGQRTAPASRAIDGSTSTSWSTIGGTPQQATLTVDLGSVHSVSGVKWMYNRSDGVDRQILQVSADGSNWTQKVVTSWRQPNQWEGFAVNQDARYVRFILPNDTNKPVLGYISEVQVWGEASSASPPVSTDELIDILIRILVEVLQDNTSSTTMSAQVASAEMAATPVSATPEAAATPGAAAVAGSDPAFSGEMLPISEVEAHTVPSDEHTVEPDRIIDGDTRTSWKTTASTPNRAIITADLGQVRSVSGVKWMYSRSDGIDQQVLDVSTDGISWTQQVVTSARQPQQWEGMAIDADIRYVRLTLTNEQELPVLGYIAEFEVWGEVASNVPGAPSTPATATSSERTAYPGSNPSFSGNVLPVSDAFASTSPAGQQTSDPGRAVDGTSDTSWATVDGEPTRAMLTVDLGSVQSVSGVKWMYNRSDGVDRQILEVSEDGSTWTQKVITSARLPLQWEGIEIDEDVRYIRFILTNDADLPVLGYIAEVEIWGEQVVVPPAEPESADRRSAATPASTDTEDPTTEAAPERQMPAGTLTAVTETATPAGTPVGSEASSIELSRATETAVTETPAATETPTETPIPEGTPAGTAPPPTQESRLAAETDVDVTPTSTETSVVEPTATATGTPATEVVDDTDQTWTGYVTGTNGSTLNCRAEPTAESTIVGTLDPGAAVTVTGSAQNGWLPVSCEGTAAWVSADFIADAPLPEETQAPTMESASTANEQEQEGAEARIAQVTATAETQTVTPEPEPTPVLEPATHEITIGVSADLSVSGTAPDETENPTGSATLPIGGEDQHVAAMTFDIDGVGDGEIVSATLLVTGSVDGAGGDVRVASGYRVDPWATTWSSLQASGAWSAGWLDWVSAGSQSTVDLTGAIPSSGPVTIMLSGSSDQPAAIASQESGSPARLILTIEE